MESTVLLTSLLSLIEERNTRETFPFVEIHNSNHQLALQVHEWKQKCNELEQKLVVAQESLSIAVAAAASSGHDNNNNNNTSGPSSSSSSSASSAPSSSASAALRNERKMREQMERLEGQLQQQSEQHQQDVQRIADLSKEQDNLELARTEQDKNIVKLQQDNDRQSHLIQHLQTENLDNQQRANLAEQQYAGLKDAIRVLQEENDTLQEENRQLEKRLVSEKDRLCNELNHLTEMVEELQRQSVISQALPQLEEKRRRDGWFGLSSSPIVDKSSSSVTASIVPTTTTITPVADPSNQIDVMRPVVVAIVPSKPKHVISAHYKMVSSVK
jgi:DNA repair exonuclease SbcCD ATPase subunit